MSNTDDIKNGLPCEDCGLVDFKDWTLLPHEVFNETCPGGDGYLCLDCFCKRRLSHTKTTITPVNTDDIDKGVLVKHNIDGSHPGVKPRPMIPMMFHNFPKGETIQRLETYRIKNAWWKRLVYGKYTVRYYALTKKGVYDITATIEE